MPRKKYVSQDDVSLCLVAKAYIIFRRGFSLAMITIDHTSNCCRVFWGILDACSPERLIDLKISCIYYSHFSLFPN